METVIFFLLFKLASLQAHQCSVVSGQSPMVKSVVSRRSFGNEYCVKEGQAMFI